MPQHLALTLQGDGLGGVTVLSAHVTEALSRPTRASLEVTAPADLDWDAQMGAPATLEVSIDGSPARWFHLRITGARIDSLALEDACRVSLELAHELALLELRADTRIFQEQDAREIVSAALEGAGVPAARVSFSLQRTPVKRAYCVQYRETDLAFVSRLLEDEGIFYFTREDANSAVITFADAQGASSSIEGGASMRYISTDERGVGVVDFTLETRAVTRRATVGDHNFETPAVDLTASADTSVPGVGEHFDFFAGHRTPEEGATLARLRMEAIQAGETVGYGASNNVACAAGAWFELEEASPAALSTRYLLTSVEHRFDVGRSADVAYTNEITVIPWDRPFRPAHTAPRPSIGGVHSAVVTGPAGAEIHTDEHGRMKGKFFWDRVGKDDDSSSCWMRAGQLPIGGSMALARVGWEMAVAYVGGDPDRPVAVARLYNAEKVSPYAYPAAKTRAALQTPSSPASGKSNEIRMEDGGGGMELYLNASKDYDGQTNNNKTETIGADEELTVGTDSEVAVGGEQSISIGASQTTQVGAADVVSIKADRSKSVGGSEAVSVGGGLEMKVGGSDSETTGGTHATLAALGVTKSSTSSQSLTVGGSLVSAAAAGVGVAVAGAKSETIGGAKLALSGASVSESVVGALATTVGGVLVQAAAGNRSGSTQGAAAITVGGLACASAGSKVSIAAKKVSIRVLGVANFLGGGGILNLTPGSAAFVGLVTLDASGKITISGNPNLVG
ncbi:type VI secretion system tip protein TssI/VgrG [Sorangium sp. So ce134]